MTEAPLSAILSSMATPEQAEAVLNNPAFKNAFKDLREEYLDKVLAANKDGIWEARIRYDTLEQVRLELERVLESIIER